MIHDSVNTAMNAGNPFEFRKRESGNYGAT
jgi:hypothetical protein